MIFKGIPISPGLGLAKCIILSDTDLMDYTGNHVSESSVEEEKAKVTAALTGAISQLSEIRDRAEAKNESELAEVMEAQIMLTQDAKLLKTILEKITGEKLTACGAVQKTMNDLAAKFDAMNNDYFKDRAQDVRDISRRILNILLGIQEIDISSLQEEVILIGKNITPSQMASLDREMVRGIVTETGGKTSHTAILANNMEIPAVFGCTGISTAVKEHTLIAVNGTEGAVIAEITGEKEIELRKEIEKLASIKLILKEMADKPTLTKDGTAVSLYANIMLPEDAEKAMEVGAEGVGLFRTEFLFMDRKSAPTEDEQYRAYRKALEIMAGRPVTIRTMDIGGDKEIEYLNLPKEENPFIGYRAIRICLDDIKLFKTQLRAILRASVHGNAMIMYPMISSIDEVRAANRILEEAKAELRAEGIKFNDKIPVGIMIEIPSAAITADILIKEVDFFSIGTNDLTQYTLAVDRMNEKLAGLYNSYQPGVLRLIQSVIKASKSAGNGKFTAMCGELAGDTVATILLLGLGLDEFSVNPSSILKIRKLISRIDMEYARKVAQKAMELSTAAEIEEYLRQVKAEATGE